MFSLRSITLIISILAFSIRSASAPEKFTAYLFAYFTGNDISQEAIHFAMSDNGHSYKALNKKKPVLSSAKISLTGGVRDPHILRGENDDFFMVATDMVSVKGWASNHGIVMLKSSNLIDWKSSAIDIHEHFPTLKTADRVWAPQVIFDRTADKYMVYFAMRLGANDRDKIYYSYADSTFTKLEAAPKLLYSYGTNSAIDADIIYKDSTYHLFFKTEGSGNGIKKATSKQLTGSYTLYDKYLQVTSAQVEGSCVFKLIDSDNYVLMYDVYTSGRYEFALSTDLTTFKADPAPISFDFTPRHGTVIPITESEKRALNAKWDPTAVMDAEVAARKPLLSIAITDGVLSLTSATSTGELAITIIDCAGKAIIRHTEAGEHMRMRLPAIPPGVYMARCSIGGRQSATIRFVRQRNGAYR